MIDVSVSKLQRAMACALSVVAEREADSKGAAAIRGDLIHACIAADLRGWQRPDVGRHRLKYNIDALRDYLGEGVMRNETAYAYDGATVEFLGENIGRAYNRPGKLCGSADIEMLREESALVVDVKTGSLPLPLPEENWQVATLALFVSLAHPKLATVTGALAKLDREGQWEFTQHTFTRDDLAVVRRKIDAARALWTQAEAAHESGWGVDPLPGPHCRFCRVKSCEYADRNTYVANAV